MQHETINRMKRKLYENEEVEDEDVGNDVVSSLPIGNLYDTTQTNGSTKSFNDNDHQDHDTDHYHHRHKQQQVASPKAKRILQLFDADLDTNSKDTMDDVNDKPLSQDFQEEYSINNNNNTKAGVYSNGYTSVATTKQAQQQQQHTYQVRSLTALYRDNRRTNDEIHSSINLGPVITCIIDTPPMQRLRGLKQLGCAEYVYMNVNHNRFEHSLGVASLAETLCRKICIQQPSLLCTEKDILCVQLAGTVCALHLFNNYTFKLPMFRDAL